MAVHFENSDGKALLQIFISTLIKSYLNYGTFVLIVI